MEVPPYGPSSIVLTDLRSVICVAIAFASANPRGRRFSDANFARSGCAPEGRLRATTRHSAMPVSDEKDMSPPLAEMLTTVKSVNSSAISFLNFCQAAPLISVSGNTSAIIPPVLSLRCPSDVNTEPSPACPWYALFLDSRFNLSAIRFCSDSEDSYAANAAFRTPSSAS